jgi:hypothetical protein
MSLTYQQYVKKHYNRSITPQQNFKEIAVLWNKEKTTTNKRGKGLIDKVKGLVKTGLRLGAIVKDKLFFPPNKLSGNSQKVFNKVKDYTVERLMVNRTPINSVVDKAINALSLGTYNKKKAELGYDKMFHLSLVLYTNKGRVSIQKNERIDVSEGGSGGGESIDISYDRMDTIGSFFGKALHKMGHHRFFQYNAFENNCQDFVAGLLQANNVLSPEAKRFVKQDAETILKAMPSYVSKMAQGATDLAGKISQIVSGQGRVPREGRAPVRKGKESKRTTRKRGGMKKLVEIIPPFY